MADEVDKDLKDNRFSYLLQPIRDLAANWDVNIAGELEEYLGELENLTFTIEGCGPALNFAEAALLIQGTTCVFSKKVEYLHNLVYQALETILDKKQREKQAAAIKDKAGRRIAADDQLDTAEAFFTLESYLEVAAESEINLDIDDETIPPALVRPPTALLALEDAAAGQGGQQGNPGEVGTYRLAHCSVHISGALLLEARDGELFDVHLRLLRKDALGSAGHNTSGDLIASFRAVSQQAAAEQAAAAAAAAEAVHEAVDAIGEGEEAAPGYDDMGHDGYCEDDEGGFAAAEDAEGAAEHLTDVAVDPEAATAAGVDQFMTDAEQALTAADDAVPDWLSQPATGLDTSQGAAETTNAAVDKPAAAATDTDRVVGCVRQQRARGRQAAGHTNGGDDDYFDPYVPLDPAEPGNLPIKPLQVRKPKRRANAATTLQSLSSSIACLNSAHHPQLQCAEFAYLLDKLSSATFAARKQGTSKQQQQQQFELPLGLPRIEPEIAAVMDWQDAAADEQREQQALLNDDADAGDLAGGDGYDNDHDDDLQDNVHILDEAGQEAAGGLRAWATGAVGLPDWMAGDSSGAVDGEMTYEELCRSHIESLIAAAAAQQVQSELAVRVSGWRARIDPILAAEEDRSAFDIHDYGTKIIDRLVEVTEEGQQQHQQQEQQQKQQDMAHAQQQTEAIDFKQIAAAQDSFEVCRLFAAMLQLVNNRNVHLVKESSSNGAEVEEDNNNNTAGQTCSKLQLQLLSVARVHEAMAEGLAGGNNDFAAGIIQRDSQLEAPPLRKQRGGAKKAKKNAEVVTADVDGLTQEKGELKAQIKAKVSKRGSKKDRDDSSSEGAGLASELTDSEGDESLAAGKAAAEKPSRSRKGAGTSKGKPGRAGKSRAAAAGRGDADGDGSSDDEFDADAENHAARSAVKEPTDGSGKASKKPAAKRARRAGAAPAVA